MQAQRQTAAAFAEVTPWREILAVEPDIAELYAKSLLLTKANYCVTRATGESEILTLRDRQAVPLAILSDRLGQRLLGTVAATVRRQWPRARILILGKVPAMLEDYLYDEQIYRLPDPEQVIAALEELYEGMWNRRSNSLDWDATRSARRFTRPRVSESAPTKTVHSALTARAFAETFGRSDSSDEGELPGEAGEPLHSFIRHTVRERSMERPQ
jgi:hypothetical protein